MCSGQGGLGVVLGVWLFVFFQSQVLEPFSGSSLRFRLALDTGGWFDDRLSRLFEFGFQL